MTRAQIRLAPSQKLLSFGTLVAVLVATLSMWAPVANAATTTVPWERSGIGFSGKATAGSGSSPNVAVVLPVSQNQLAWVALKNINGLASGNAVQAVNALTGEAYGSPIPLPSGNVPVAMSYWRPNLGSTSASSDDPYIAVLANNSTTGVDYVTFINVLTKTVVSTISLGGSLGTAIAASETNDVIAVTDSNSTNTASRVKIISMVSRSVTGTFASIATTGNRLTSLAFDSLGAHIAIVSPALHKVYNLQPSYIGSSTYVQATGSTYTGSSSFNPQYIASDQSNINSSSFYVTTTGSSKALYEVANAWPGITSPSATLLTSFATTPGPLQVSGTSQYAYVSLPANTTNNVAVVDIANATVSNYLNTGVSPQTLALSWDSGRVLASNGASATPNLASLGTYFNAPLSLSSMSGQVSAIALPVSSFIHYNIYAINGSTISVIDSSTGNVIANVADTNDPVRVVTSQDGRSIYVVNNQGGGASGTLPQVLRYETRLFGSAVNTTPTPITINQSANAPLGYSLALVPRITDALLSPAQNCLVLVDANNSAVITLDVGAFDSATYQNKVVSVVQLQSSSAVDPQSIASSPDGAHIYVSSQSLDHSTGGITVLSGGNSTTGYAFEAYQAASSLKDAPPVDSGVSPVSLTAPSKIAVSRNGQSLFVLDPVAVTPLLFAFGIQSDGTLRDAPQPALLAGNQPVSFSMSPEDSVVYVADGYTGKTSAMNLSIQVSNVDVGHVSFDSSVILQSKALLPVATGATPDGQFFVTSYQQYYLGPHYVQPLVNEVAIFNSANGSWFTLAGTPEEISYITVAPVSSSQWLTSTLSYDGQQSWTELLQGGINQSERADRTLVDHVNAGTPSDAPGVSAGANTALRSYDFSLNSLSVESVGTSLNLTASYDSARVANSMDSASSVPSFAHGWRLSTGITASQNPVGTLFPCQISVTQSDGTIIYFNPSTAVGSACPLSGYEPLPWEQASLSNLTSCAGSGSDACWAVTNLLSGITTTIDATASTHRVLTQTDRNSNVTTYNYSGSQLVSVSSGGRALTFSYASAGTSSCASSVNGTTLAKCWIVTDPIGRSVNYQLSGSPSSGYDLAAVTLSPPSGSALTPATYVFTYANHLLTSWTDPQNYIDLGGATGGATKISYSPLVSWVSAITSPAVSGQGASMNLSFAPTTTFTYATADLFAGNSQVLITDPTSNNNQANGANLPGGNVTLDSYVNWGLVSQVQGYGPSETNDINPTAVTSQAVTTVRDPLTLMPDETLNALADTGEGQYFNNGVMFTAYDILGNAIETWSPGTESGIWVTSLYAFNQFNEPLSVIDAKGNASFMTYDGNGNIQTVTSLATNSFTAPPVTSNFYLSNGLLCASRDAVEVASYGVLSSCAATHATLYAYNSYGDLVSTTSPTGAISSFAYDANGNQCASLSPNGYALGYRLTSCPASPQPYESVTLSRDLYGAATSSSTPSNAPGGISYTFTNANGAVLSTLSAPASLATCNPSVSAGCLFASYTQYNALGQVVSSVSPATTSGVVGPTSHLFYDPNGNSVTTVSPDGSTSLSIPNSLGATSSSATGLSSTPSCSIASDSALCPNSSYSKNNGAGQVIASYSPSSSGGGVLSSTTVYDPMGNVVNSTDPTGAISTSTYDANGQLLQSVSTKGAMTTGSTSAYNPNGSVCWSTPLVVSGTPDCANPPLGALNQTTLNYYDQDGRLVATTTPGTVTYSPATPSACNPLTSSTCDGVTYYSYDEVGHRTQTVTPAGPSGTRGVTSSYFDANGNLVATVTSIGAGTGCNPLTSSTCIGVSYSVYDADNRLLSTSYTDGTRSVTYTYNADGSKATQSDGTGTSTFSYDSAGRLIGTTNGAGATTTWGYNTLGQLICQSYDNVAGNTCRGSGAGTSSPPAGLLTFTYDANGRASSLITWSGVTLTTAYDCAGSKAWVSTGTASVLSCDASHLGTPAIPTSSSAITTTYSQNATGQFTNQATTTNGGATNLLSFAFSYDDLSRLISSTPTVNSLTKTTDSYGYDPSSRVTSGPITGTTGNPNYSYSPTGAITQATTHFASAAYSQNGQLCWTNPTAVSSPSCVSTPSTATNFTYDLNGNRTGTSSATNSTALSWQATSGRLTCINTAGTTCSTTSPTSTTTLYSYDGDGHRMTSSNNGTTNAFIWDTGASQLLADSTHDYVYLQGSVTPDLQINLTTGTVDLLIQDQNANTRGVVQVVGANTSLNGMIVNYTDYDAYGNAITQSGGTINPGGMANNGVTTDISTSFAFGAGYWDSSNLTYLVHRYLDNETGQFISVDPLVDQTREAYVYAGDGPVMAVDALGLKTDAWCLSAGVRASVFGFSGSLCLARVRETHEVGLMGSYSTFPGGSLNVGTQLSKTLNLPKLSAGIIGLLHGGDISLSVVYETTNCRVLDCLRKKFKYSGVGVSIPEMFPVASLAFSAGVISGEYKGQGISGSYAGMGASFGMSDRGIQSVNTYTHIYDVHGKARDFWYDNIGAVNNSIGAPLVGAANLAERINSVYNWFRSLW